MDMNNRHMVNGKWFNHKVVVYCQLMDARVWCYKNCVRDFGNVGNEFYFVSNADCVNFTLWWK